jgi:hypothetical protein
LVRYDKEFGHSPDSMTTLLSWITASLVERDIHRQELYKEDIDAVEDADVAPEDLPAFEVILQSFLAEAQKVAATSTYQTAIMAIRGSVPVGFPKELVGELTTPEIAQRYVRDKWGSEPRAKRVEDGDWIEHADDIQQALEDHLSKGSEGRVFTCLGPVDDTVIIGKKFLKWIVLLC